MIDPAAAEPSVEPSVELSEVLADDELFARLSRRVPVSDGDPLAQLLASWVAEVDEATEADLAREHDLASEHDVAAAAPGAAPVVALAPVASRHRSRRFARGSRLAVVVTAVGVGLGSLTGVAAAVTGDPLAPYRPMISGVLGGADTPSGSARSAATDPGAAEGTTAGASERAARQSKPGKPELAKGEHPAGAPGLAAVAAARDGWLARWQGLPPQAVGPGGRHAIDGLDGRDGTARAGGPAGSDGDGRPGSSRADEVRRDGDKHRGNGSDQGAGSAVPHRAGAPDGDAGSDEGGAATTPPGHLVWRR